MCCMLPWCAVYGAVPHYRSVSAFISWSLGIWSPLHLVDAVPHCLKGGYSPQSCCVDSVCVCYKFSDTTNRRSFESMRLWIEDVRKHTHGLSIMMLVGNKIDKDPRDVSRKEGQEFALENSMLFIETSAKTREGVKDAFEELVMKILDTPPLLETATPVRKEIALDGKDEELSNAACC
eukprot:GHVO01065238.1.p1 GENE.GHVO01065238.1~~GHVO01065238.1.p1  ORF type:complete len:178 (+),score=21.39 GHVO01065238.1:296-829(+)